MALTIEQFRKSLVDSGLLTEIELSALLESLPESRRPGDGEQLARELVRQKKLTVYQATALYQGKGAGLVLGNYLVQDKLGQGGMGVVLKAIHRRMHRIVALKVVSTQVVKSADALARFQREARAAARLSHPNIVAAFDADETKGTHYLVMEYVEGEDLSSYLKKHGPLPAEKALGCVIQAARGLEYAHHQGVIHRDIKPSNLLLDRSGVVKILDMGLARINAADEPGGVAAQAALTGTGVVMGTVDYMSPEQALDTRTADARSDIYSLGCTLYMLIVGQPVYRGDTILKRLLEHRDNPIPSLFETLDSPPSFASDLDRIFHRMLEKKPADRYQTMSEALADLLACQQGRAVSPVIPEFPTGDAGFTSFLQGLGSTVATSRPTIPDASVLEEPTRKKGRSADPASQTISGMPTLVGPGGDNETEPTFLAAPSPISDALNPSPGPATKRRRGKSAHAVRWMIVAGAAVLLAVSLSALPGLRPEKSPGKTGVDVANGNSKPADSSSLPGPDPRPTLPAGQWQLTFDGLQSYVEADDLKLDPKNLDGLTIEAWVTPRGTKTANLVSWLGETWIAVFQMDGGFGLSRFDPEHSRVYYAAGTARTGERTHVAAVWQGESLELFVNGRRLNLIKVDYKAGPTSGGLFLGGAPTDRIDGDRFFRGGIDDLRITRGVRYTESFEPEFPLSARSDTLALFPFEEGSGVQTRESISATNSARLHGAKWEAVVQSELPDEPPRAKPPFDLAAARKLQDDWAKFLNVPVEFENSIGMKFRLIPPGEYTRGASREETEAMVRQGGDPVWQMHFRSESPPHAVRITRPFFLGMYEVTQKQFQDVMKTNPSFFSAVGNGKDRLENPDTDDLPAETILFREGLDFCNRLSEMDRLQPAYDILQNPPRRLTGAGYRLPTEAEWEYACRAGSTTKYCFGDDPQDLTQYAWIASNSGNRTHPVGQLLPNAFKLYDMHGNVWENCQDWHLVEAYKPFTSGVTEDPAGPITPTGSIVARGGGYDLGADMVRSTLRGAEPIDRMLPFNGYRLLLPVDSARKVVAAQGPE